MSDQHFENVDDFEDLGLSSDHHKRSFNDLDGSDDQRELEQQVRRHRQEELLGQEFQRHQQEMMEVLAHQPHSHYQMYSLGIPNHQFHYAESIPGPIDGVEQDSNYLSSINPGDHHHSVPMSLSGMEMLNNPDLQHGRKARGQMVQRDWQEWFQDLMNFYECHGHCNVPSTYDVPGSNRKLGAWLINQRRNKKKGKLRPDREAQLQKLVEEGKLWWDAERPAANHQSWDAWYKDLLDYDEACGHANVPVVYCCPENSRKLGQWLNNQKRLKRQGQLRPEREALLQVLVENGRLVW